jgi:hypothetical protein
LRRACFVNSNGRRFPSGPGAIQTWRGRIAGLVTDIEMGGMSGIDTLIVQLQDNQWQDSF